MTYHFSPKTLTLQLIEEKLIADQGAVYNKLLKIELDSYKKTSNQMNQTRDYLGASSIGNSCGRSIWYGFNKANKKPLKPKQILLFNRGHLEECRFRALLKLINIELNNDPIDLAFSALNGKFRGHLDDIGIGFIEYPNKQLVCEFKTHNNTSFNRLVKYGVEKAHYAHFVQIQMYMGGKNLDLATYFAINKNTDELYLQFLSFDKGIFNHYLERAQLIIDSKEPLPKISEKNDYYICRMCQYNDNCH